MVPVLGGRDHHQTHLIMEEKPGAEWKYNSSDL